jgi:hypothetical protein
MSNEPFWCSPSVCTALPYQGDQVLSLLTWVQIARDCGIALLVLGLLAVLIAWLGHLPWPFRLGGVLPLAASGFAWIAAAHLQDTFGYLVQLEGELQTRMPQSLNTRLLLETANTLQDAMVLRWLVVGVAIVLLLACILVLWRGFLMRERLSNQSAGDLPL